MKNEIDKYFRGSSYDYFIFLRTYSRWNDELGRRESWEESVDRYINFMKENLGSKLTDVEYNDIRENILYQKVMPSMRLLWAAGDAARRTSSTTYNCSFIAPTKLDDFGEVLYLLTCGCGVGFSVERHVVNQLPIVIKQTGNKTKTHVVDDSREGWADALKLGIKTWYDGNDIDFNFSKIREKGARLKTMGGRASGPLPLVGLLQFTREKILSRQGDRLRPIDVHDIICKIGDIVVMGGVRRSSEISLSDIDDADMRNAKAGSFYVSEPQRTMANNSVAYKTKPTQQEFMEEWLSLMKSGSGERGIFNRSGMQEQMPIRRWEKTGDNYYTLGTNPCGEITLRSKQFCNLTEVVARAEDTFDTLKDKIRIATIMGTYQSSLTKLPYLSKEWKKNCDEERLLGVSITGQYDCEEVRKPRTLKRLRDYSIEINRQYAKKFKISPSLSITTCKPSGTVSQLVNSSSGAHPRYSKGYIRRVRISSTDPLYRLLRDQGVPCHPEVGYTEKDAMTFVFDFPVRAPKGCITRHDVTALDQLNHWKILKDNYTEHNPSITVYVGTNEWLEVANWVYNNWEIVGGLSFLPKEDDDHVYELAPYQEITKDEYEKLMKVFPKVDFSRLSEYEKDDQTEGAKELACKSGACEIV